MQNDVGQSNIAGYYVKRHRSSFPPQKWHRICVCENGGRWLQHCSSHGRLLAHSLSPLLDRRRRLLLVITVTRLLVVSIALTQSGSSSSSLHQLARKLGLGRRGNECEPLVKLLLSICKIELLILGAKRINVSNFG